MATQNEIATAAKALEEARQQFDFIESRYFEGECTLRALRAAADELKTCETALENAHRGVKTPDSNSPEALDFVLSAAKSNLAARRGTPWIREQLNRVVNEIEAQRKRAVSGGL